MTYFSWSTSSGNTQHVTFPRWKEPDQGPLLIEAPDIGQDERGLLKLNWPALPKHKDDQIKIEARTLVILVELLNEYAAQS